MCIHKTNSFNIFLLIFSLYLVCYRQEKLLEGCQVVSIFHSRLWEGGKHKNREDAQRQTNTNLKKIWHDVWEDNWPCL